MGLPLSTTVQRITKVVTEQMMHEVVTEVMRPLMTEGASRDNWAEGRVERER